jgi:hypothetical protein
VKRIATFAALAAAATLAACSYTEEPRFIGNGASTPYSAPESPAPLSYYSPYPREYSAPPPDAAPVYVAPASCYAPAHYNRWGYWVPARYVC